MQQNRRSAANPILFDDAVRSTPQFGTGGEMNGVDFVVGFQREGSGLDPHHPAAEALIRRNLGLRRQTARANQADANGENNSHTLKPLQALAPPLRTLRLFTSEPRSQLVHPARLLGCCLHQIGILAHDVQ